MNGSAADARPEARPVVEPNALPLRNSLKIAKASKTAENRNFSLPEHLPDNSVDRNASDARE